MDIGAACAVAESSIDIREKKIAGFIVLSPGRVFFFDPCFCLLETIIRSADGYRCVRADRYNSRRMIYRC